MLNRRAGEGCSCNVTPGNVRLLKCSEDTTPIQANPVCFLLLKLTNYELAFI